ncbi:MAG: UDP-N-acetylmuramate dehydrogenase [bacterium]|nr:UDP-N-acetylmuramate dehydrogenase [bacterium]
MKFLENVSLAEYTTFKIGGKAKYFCVVKNEEELYEALDFAKGKNTESLIMPFFILGGGSNILVSDDGFDGLVVKMEMTGVSFEDGEKSDNKTDVGKILVTAQAGDNWDRLVAETVKKELWGLENLSGIPGTVGAAPVQDIGAYGAEAKDTIVSVRAIDSTTGAARTFTNSECQFSYRESFFKTAEGKKYIITSVTFKLSKIPSPNLSYKDLKEYFSENGREERDSLSSRPPSLSEIRKAVIEIRKGKFPELSKVGTAGSFWKNPIISNQQFEKLKIRYPNTPSFSFGDKIKIPLAWILDNVCGLKGYTKGPVSLWTNQPLVVVAEKGTSFKEIESLTCEVTNIVKQKTGIDIEKEVQYIA